MKSAIFEENSKLTLILPNIIWRWVMWKTYATILWFAYDKMRNVFKMKGSGILTQRKSDMLSIIIDIGRLYFHLLILIVC